MGPLKVIIIIIIIIIMQLIYIAHIRRLYALYNVVRGKQLSHKKSNLLAPKI